MPIRNPRIKLEGIEIALHWGDRSENTVTSFKGVGPGKPGIDTGD